MTAVLCNPNTDQQLCRRQACRAPALCDSGWVSDKRCRESFSGVTRGKYPRLGDERARVHGNPLVYGHKHMFKTVFK